LKAIVLAVLSMSALSFGQYSSTKYNVRSIQYIEDQNGSGWEGFYVYDLTEVANPSSSVQLYSPENDATGGQEKRHQNANSYLSIMLTAKSTALPVQVKIAGTWSNQVISGHYPNGILRILGVML
jgi:hypothetical protein